MARRRKRTRPQPDKIFSLLSEARLLLDSGAVIALERTAELSVARQQLLVELPPVARHHDVGEDVEDVHVEVELMHSIASSVGCAGSPYVIPPRPAGERASALSTSQGTSQRSG